MKLVIPMGKAISCLPLSSCYKPIRALQPAISTNEYSQHAHIINLLWNTGTVLCICHTTLREKQQHGSMVWLKEENIS
jgi:hypothetical protein